MSDVHDSHDNDDAPPKKAGLGALILPLAGVIVGLGAGGALGAKVVAPKVTAGITSSASAADVAGAHTKAKKHSDDEDGEDAEEHDDEEAEDEEHGDEKKEGGHGAAPSNYVIGDMVLNPAGSGGTRFLMMSVAFDLKDSASVEKLKTHEAEIRDAMLSVIGARTVEQLADIAARDPLKAEIKTLVGRITKKPKAIKRVNFPQFVIQ
jgi:flagellar protein FliL